MDQGESRLTKVVVVTVLAGTVVMMMVGALLPLCGTVVVPTIALADFVASSRLSALMPGKIGKRYTYLLPVQA